MGENICKTCLIWVYTMYEELHRSVIKKTTHFKIWTEDLNRNFSKIMAVASKHTENMFSLISHQGNTNEAHSEMLFHALLGCLPRKTGSDKC